MRRTGWMLIVLLLGLACGRGTPVALREPSNRPAPGGEDQLDGGSEDIDSLGPDIPDAFVPFFPDIGVLDAGQPDFGLPDASVPDSGDRLCTPIIAESELRLSGAFPRTPQPSAATVVDAEPLLIEGQTRRGRFSIEYTGPRIESRLQAQQNVAVLIERQTSGDLESLLVVVLAGGLDPELILFDGVEADFTAGLGEWRDEPCTPVPLIEGCPPVVAQRLETLDTDGRLVTARLGQPAEIAGVSITLTAAYRFLNGACAGVGPVRHAGYFLPAR